MTIAQRSAAIWATLASDLSDLTVLAYVEEFPSPSKIIRILAYCLRWCSNASHTVPHKTYGPLTAKKIKAGSIALYKAVQWQFFKTEILRIRSDRRISKRYPIGRLIPFLDKYGLLRVGGRFQNLFLLYDEKHPIIPPKTRFVTKLLIF